MGDDGERLIFRDGDAGSSSAPILGSLASSPSLAAPEKDIPADALGKFDQYIVLRQLGGGAFGIVYLALDTVSKTKVAVKTLHPLLRDNADEMARMRANFAIVSRLHHPHIAPALVLHLVQNVENFAGGLSNPLRISAGDPVLLMSYAPGETLSSWKRQLLHLCISSTYQTSHYIFLYFFQSSNYYRFMMFFYNPVKFHYRNSI